MILSMLLRGGDLFQILLTLLFMLPPMMLALSLHESAHGYIAWKCGDNTAYNLGRLTLNPLKHLDPVGFICLLVFGYGWANPVPINTRHFKNPKRGMALSALAGPVANLLLGVLCAVVAGVLWGCYSYTYYFTTAPAYWTLVLRLLEEALYFSAMINFVYMTFNMIPVPPFDGSRVLLFFLPPRAYFGIMRYERQIMIGVLVGMTILANLGLSPFGWIASNLTDLIYVPIALDLF